MFSPSSKFVCQHQPLGFNQESFYHFNGYGLTSSQEDISTMPAGNYSQVALSVCANQHVFRSFGDNLKKKHFESNQEIRRGRFSTNYTHSDVTEHQTMLIPAAGYDAHYIRSAHDSNFTRRYQFIGNVNDTKHNRVTKTYQSPCDLSQFQTVSVPEEIELPNDVPLGSSNASRSQTSQQSCADCRCPEQVCSNEQILVNEDDCFGCQNADDVGELTAIHGKIGES